MTALLACLVSALCIAMNDIDEEEKQEIRYNVMIEEDVLREMKSQLKDEPDSVHSRMILTTGLGTLAKKYGRQTALTKASNSGSGDGDAPTQSPPIVRKHSERLAEMALVCQEAAYLGFNTNPQNDAVVAASLSLLALVAKQEVVRQRHVEAADVYGLDIPIKCMRDALERAKNVEDNENEPANEAVNGPDDSDEFSPEQQSAELQRKGCLLLGALADGDSSMSRLVAQEGGIQAVLQAVDWYRCHAEVANWALWAIFILSYEDLPNKCIVVEHDGVSVVIRTLKSVTGSLDVARHGIAILFDLMREQDKSTSGPQLDVWKIRNAALNEGVHQAIVGTMKEYSTAMDIIMMGQAILVGTDYQGDIPQYSPIG